MPRAVSTLRERASYFGERGIGTSGTDATDYQEQCPVISGTGKPDSLISISKLKEKNGCLALLTIQLTSLTSEIIGFFWML